MAELAPRADTPRSPLQLYLDLETHPYRCHNQFTPVCLENSLDSTCNDGTYGKGGRGDLEVIFFLLAPVYSARLACCLLVVAWPAGENLSGNTHTHTHTH